MESPAVSSTHHLIPDAAGAGGGRGASVTSSVSISVSSTPVEGHVNDGSPPNYFEVRCFSLVPFFSNRSRPVNTGSTPSRSFF